MGNKLRHFELTWWWPWSGIWQLVSCIIVLLDTLYLQSVALPPLPPFNPVVGGAPCAAAAATRPAFNTNQFSPPPSSPRTKEMHRQDLSSLSLPTNSLEGRTSQEEMRGDALTEKYAANPHPSSCYILSTHHKYSSTFLKRSTERGVFLGMYTSNIAKLGCGHICFASCVLVKGLCTLMHITRHQKISTAHRHWHWTAAIFSEQEARL